MFVEFIGLCGGLLLLVYGSELTVDAVSSVADRIGVSTLFVGVTVVAVGSSLPEIATSIYGSLYGRGDFVVAHIVGSATSQITLGIGVVAFATSLSMPRETVRRYGAGMLVAMGLMLLAVRSGQLTRVGGVLLVGAYLAFLLARFERDEHHEAMARRVDDESSAPGIALRTALGLGMVVGGGHLLVTGASGIATTLGVPWYVLGVVTGLGTTIPEIAVAVSSVYHHEQSIAVGTLLGSNITDPLFSLGVGAVVGGLSIADPRAAVLGTGYMLAASAAVLAVAYVRETFGPAEGVLCVVLYLPSFFIG